MSPIQNKIVSIVEKYIRKYYLEYCTICDSVKDKQQLQKDDFASTGQHTYVGQLALIVPETLDNLLQNGLDEDEWNYYKSKLGTQWFAKKFPEFSPIQKHG